MDLWHSAARMVLEPRPSGSSWLPLLIALVAAIAGLAYLAHRLRKLRRESTQRAEELQALTEFADSVASAPPDPEELAEIAYIEAARLLDTDFFQIGVFEGDQYRTLIWTRGGEQTEKGRFDLQPGNEGIIGWVRRTGRPLLVRDYIAERETLPATPSYRSPDPPRSGLFVPLKFSDQVLGVIALQSRSPHAFTEHHQRLLRILAGNLAFALASTGFQSEIQNLSRQLILVNQITRRLLTPKPELEVYHEVARLISRALENAQVRIFERIEDQVILLASAPSHESAETTVDLSIVELAVHQGRTLVYGASDETDSDEGPHAGEKDEIGSQLAIPFKVEDEVLGALHLHSDERRSFSQEAISLAEILATQLAMALLETRTFVQQQEDSWISTVLLEVAHYAAQPGDAEKAIQAVLQLTTLLAGTRWAIVLLPESPGGALRVGPVAGVRRKTVDLLSQGRLQPEAIGVFPPLVDSESGIPIELPTEFRSALDSTDATALILGDRTTLLGVLLTEGQAVVGRRNSLLAGIARQISLRLENARLVDEVAARKSLEREISMARDIQVSFLPKTIPDHPEWEIGVTWQVAREVGGDFYDFIPLSPGENGPRWGVVIADVADKGVPAALFMALGRTLLRSVAIARFDPAQTLQRLNELIFADTQATLFISAFYGVWEPDIGELTFANAGHNPPLLFHPEERARVIDQHGMVLGVKQSVAYENHRIRLQRDSLFVLYTDGVTEATNPKGELFGLHRLEGLVLGLAEWRAQRVADHIAKRVREFIAEPELSDDLTAIVIRYVPEARVTPQI